ncbi:MAG TPA: phosphoribosylformylglycinamidine synthase subunit PurQ [Gemmatimonadales bacterium]|jgi:phosphoribosylformylglycinamidine synthase|nr:phosphoribosylformylglycinamidine synthase subunit PurQ [Gemmatimonadales bacterium]
MSARVAVVRFPGSNCETESLAAVERAGGDARLIDYRDTDLHGAAAVILPGGFAYGDYLRSGAIARFSPIMAAVRAHAAAGGVVLGICNGFQILCEARLLPGALLHNAQQRFVARPVDVRIERNDTACTADYRVGEVIRIPVAHGEGRFVASPDVLTQLDRDNCVLMRYVQVDGTDVPHNPNGSTDDIAGICNAAGTVLGFMPHPERLADASLGSDVGQRFFTSLVKRVVTRAAA